MSKTELKTLQKKINNYNDDDEKKGRRYWNNKYNCFNYQPLILDEVLAVGDESFKNKCKNRLNRFWDSNVTILAVSHSMKYILESCSKAIWINKGVTEASGETSKVIETYLKSVSSETSLTIQ